MDSGSLKQTLFIFVTKNLRNDPSLKLVGSEIPVEGTIYQPLRSGRIWHKVNF